MDQTWDRACGPRPSTASVQVRELSWQGLHNPCPQAKDLGSHGDGHGERLVQEYLSPARLQALAQVDDLRLVSVLDVCVDTREHSLGNFETWAPPWAACGCCGWLAVAWWTWTALAPFRPWSPLCLLEQLEVLDLEGNSVEDLGQVRYLQLCPRLATLTLEGNLVCLRPSPGPRNEAPQHYNYRAEVRKLIPHLQVLDEVPATHTGLPASRKLDQDWLMVKEAIKEGRVLGGLLPGLDHPHGYPIRRLGLELSLPETQPRAPRPWPLSLLVPGGPLPEGLLPTDPAPEDVASTLTHGAGPVLCGNPTKGLRERQHQCPAPPERLLRCRPEDLAPSTPTPGPDPADSCDLSALAGLPAWRELGLRHLESQQEGAEAPWRRPRRGPEEQEDETGPHTPPSPLSLAPEPSRTVGYTLLPCPPKLPVPPDSSSSNQGSTGLQFRARRLRALGSSGPGLGQGLAAVAALRALEVGSGPSPRARGCLDPKPTQDPAARSPALRCLPHLSPVTPAQTRP
ncbi:leucine-rich repeat-containing protein 56 isoform X6 [Pteropus alecto]|uniref:leucine-rich repeat-containing protein 56 isoform X6 n=1 Tax=Pteropus alecto TaxID=9402 RepID=UPI0007686874|nr:leucine-rich repeat-containing protein 56 isoform X6 [Pteropus alecto]